VISIIEFNSFLTSMDYPMGKFFYGYGMVLLVKYVPVVIPSLSLLASTFTSRRDIETR
jgi:hypothetical protein